MVYNKNIPIEFKKFDPKKELTIVFIHGLGGWENEFLYIIEELVKSDLINKVNIIVESRIDTGFKTIQDQSNEVINSIEKHLQKNKHKIILIGHSQGGVISLLLLEKLLKKNKEVVGLVLVGTPLGGINYVLDFIKLNKEEYPSVVHLLEEGALGYKLENNPKGILDLMCDNLFPIIDRSNDIIIKNGILTKIIIGIKPKEIEYPASIRTFLPIIPNLIKSGLINFNAIFHNLISKFSFNALSDFKKAIDKGNLFNSIEFTGSHENDLLISKKNQQWPYKNKCIEEIISNEVVHNWKISVLVSKSHEDRIKAELESIKAAETIKNLIIEILGN